MSNPAASTPPVVAPAPLAAPKTNAPSGYVQIQTANGPAYFQQTPSGLAIVSDPTTLSKLKNGTLPSTVQPYSPSLTFANPTASSAPSPGTIPSSTQPTSIPTASNPAPSTPPAAAQAPTANPNVSSGYVQIQTANGPAYFQQTPSGLAAVNDPTTLSKLKTGALPSTNQPYSPSLTFANAPVPPTKGGTGNLIPAPPASTQGQWSSVPASGQPPSQTNQTLQATAPAQPSSTFSSINTTTANTTPMTAAGKPAISLSSAITAAKPAAEITLGALSAVGKVASKTVPGLPGTLLSIVGKGKTGSEVFVAYQNAGVPGAAVQIAYSAISSHLVTKAMELCATSALRVGISEGLVAAPAISGTAIAYGGAVAVTGVVSYKVGEYFIAPYVAPTIGGWMFDAAPGLFTPK